MRALYLYKGNFLYGKTLLRKALFWDYSLDFISPNVAGSFDSLGARVTKKCEKEEKKKEKRLVPCTWKWHPINSNRILLGLAASAGVGHSLNPESSPPSLLKAFSLMTLQRWEKVAAQKGPGSKGGIDPGTRPSFLSLPRASSSSSSPPFCSLSSLPLHTSLSAVPIFIGLTLQNLSFLLFSL